MNVERITKEYLSQLDHLKKLEKQVEQYKELLKKAIYAEGEPDENGHLWLASGDYLLKIQKSQGQPKLSREAAESWAKTKGIWDKVSETVQVLDEDKLMAYMYIHQEDGQLEDEFRQLYVRPDPVYSFIRPLEQEAVDY